MSFYATKKDGREWDKRPLRKQKFIDKYIFKKLKNDLIEKGYTISKDVSEIVEKYPLFDFDFIIEKVIKKTIKKEATRQKRFTHFYNTELLDEIVKKSADKAQITAQETLTRATKGHCYYS